MNAALPELLHPTDAPRPRVSRTAALLIYLFVVAIALFAYRGTSDIMPAGDDLTAVLDIQRGNEKGLMAFFTHPPVVKNYRPLQSILTWAAGSATQDRLVGLRILHLASLASLIGVAVLWARTMGLSRFGVAGAALIAALHPGLTGQVCDLDTFACMLCPALMWLAAWVLFVWREKLLLALPAAAALFIIAVGFKEYVFGLTTLGALVVFWFRPSRRILAAVAVGLFFALLVGASMYVRRFVTPDDAAAAHEVALPAIGLAYVPRNLALYALALLLPFSTVWVHEHQGQLTTYAAIAGGILAVVGLLSVGIWLRIRADPPPVVRRGIAGLIGAQPAEGGGGGVEGVGGFNAASWTIFLLLAAPAATFPNNVLAKVSESYLAAPVIVLALLAGLSIDGWRTLPRSGRVVGALAAVALVASSLVTIRYKADAVRGCGLLADNQFRQILAFLPPGVSNQKIAILFFNKDLDTNRTYSVYRMDYDIPAFDPIGLDWYRPGMKLRMTQFGVDRLAQFDPYGYDLALYWDMDSKTYKKVPR